MNELSKDEISLIELYLEREGFKWVDLKQIEREGKTVFSLLIKKEDYTTQRIIDLKHIEE